MGEDREAEAASTTALRATAHPLRLRMLSLLTGAEMSAAEVARELGITQANASYHLRVLARAGEVVEAGEERVRGGIAKKYRHPWERRERTVGDQATHEQYLRSMGAELIRRDRLRKPGTRRLIADAEMWVAPAVRDEVMDLVTRASRLIHAEAQPPRTPGTVHVNLTLAVFEMDDRAPGTEGRRAQDARSADEEEA
jgi:DNA-binding transcriptional ArsR family regulator